MADKIIVLSKRPAKLKKSFDINFDLTDTANTPFERRNSDKFKDYYGQIWKEIELHE